MSAVLIALQPKANLRLGKGHRFLHQEGKPQVFALIAVSVPVRLIKIDGDLPPCSVHNNHDRKYHNHKPEARLQSGPIVVHLLFLVTGYNQSEGVVPELAVQSALVVAARARVEPIDVIGRYCKVLN